jgi:hypothetical protein
MIISWSLTYGASSFFNFLMKQLFTLIIGLSLSSLLHGQGFSKLYRFAPDSSTLRTSAIGVHADASGAFLWGNHASAFVGTLHSYVAKIDTAGDVVWLRTLGDSLQLFSAAGNSCFTPLQNGQYLYLPWLFLGHPSTRTTFGHTFLTWLDAQGQVIRQLRVSDSIQSNTLYQCLELSNGDLLCTGFKSSTTLAPDSNLAWHAHWLVRFDSLGNKLWEKLISPSFRGISPGPWPYMLRLSARGDSMFIASGYKIDSSRVGGLWSCFSAFDGDGNHLWDRFLHGNNHILFGEEFFSEAKPVNDSLWFFTTTLSDTLFGGPGGAPTFPSHFRVVQGYLTNQGDTLGVRDLRSRYNHPFQIQTAANQIHILPDGGKLISFELIRSFTSTVIHSLQKLDRFDSLQWERWYYLDTAFHFIQSNGIQGLSEAPNGDLYLSGTYQILRNQSGDSTGTFAWLTRTDSFGCVVPGCHLGDSIFTTPTSLPVVQYSRELEVNLFPNPADSYLQVEVKSTQLPAGLRMAVFNYSGQQLLAEVPLEQGRGRIDVAALSPGLYLCRIRSIDGVITYKKFVKR